MKNYFCGWYFKCQSENQTLAVIPAVHISNGRPSCSVQLITEEGAWNVRFPYDDFRQQKGGLRIEIGDNYFGEDGMKLSLLTTNLHVTGLVRFGEFSPIKYDIMGPFKYVPFMECRHSVISMKHTVNGELLINGVTYHFDDAVGYIEGDRGYSFPNRYAWTQCGFQDISLMLSVADIPFFSGCFTGVVGVIYWRRKEYRLATYLGAKVIKIENGELVVRQGNTKLTVKLIKKNAHPLNAPVNGDMQRTIHESASCRAYYTFQKNDCTLFSFETDRASFEYEY